MSEASATASNWFSPSNGGGGVGGGAGRGRSSNWGQRDDDSSGRQGTQGGKKRDLFGPGASLFESFGFSTKSAQSEDAPSHTEHTTTPAQVQPAVAAHARAPVSSPTTFLAP